jgi:restriction system protein
MPITDKLDKITPEGLRAATIFVDSMSSEIRDMAKRALSDGVKDPLIWLLDCHDEAGVRMAQEWQEPDVMDGRPVDEIPYAISRAVSYETASARFAKLTGLGYLDLNIPEPRKEHIDVLAVTAGCIFVIGLPRDPEYREYIPRPGELVTILSQVLAKPPQDLLMQAIVQPVDQTKEGELIKALSIPWMAIAMEIQRDPEFLYLFAKNPRKFEEFIAATYERAGWPHVVLTPQSGDRGRDVIATKPGFGSIRFLDQCKAYSPGNFVTHDDVRGMFGVLNLSPNASKAIVTTTSDFQPGIFASDEFKAVMPHRLELRNGVALRQWLKEVAVSKQ